MIPRLTKRLITVTYVWAYVSAWLATYYFASERWALGVIWGAVCGGYGALAVKWARRENQQFNHYTPKETR